MRTRIRWQPASGSPTALPELDIDPVRTALIVVDVQNYSDSNLKIAPNCARLRDFFKERGLDVIYLRVGSLLPDRRDLHEKRALAWLKPTEADPPKDVHKGAYSHEVIDALKPGPDDLVLDKNSSGAFASSPLDQHLHSMGIENLVLCGASTNHCVSNTARGGADRGYNVIIVDDACIDPSSVAHEITMRSFSRSMGAVRQTRELIGELGAALDAVGVSA